MNSSELVEKIKYVLDEKMAEDIEVIKVDAITSLTDYFVIATAKSTTHIKVLAEEVEEILSKKDKLEPFTKESGADNWIVLDYNSVIVHLFLEETRTVYNLEKLWEKVRVEEISE